MLSVFCYVKNLCNTLNRYPCDSTSSLAVSTTKDYGAVDHGTAFLVEVSILSLDRIFFNGKYRCHEFFYHKLI